VQDLFRVPFARFDGLVRASNEGRLDQEFLVVLGKYHPFWKIP